MPYGQDDAPVKARAALNELVPEIKAMVVNPNLRAEDRLHAAHILIAISELPTE